VKQTTLQYKKDKGLDVVTIIPVLKIGPSITPSVPSNIQLVLSLLMGNPHMLLGLKGLWLISGSI
jgi:hypothetical protein